MSKPNRFRYSSINYKFNQLLHIKDMVQCMKMQFINNEQDYDSIGLSYRSSEQDVFVMTSLFGYPRVSPMCHFENIYIYNFYLQVMRYADFLMQPYAKEISMRKIRIKSKNKNEPRILQKNFKELFEKFQTAFDPQRQL